MKQKDSDYDERTDTRNTMTRIMDMVKEQHADKYISMGLAYMTICKSYRDSTIVDQQFSVPPPPPRIPRLQWFLNVYVLDVLQIMDGCMAKVASVWEYSKN